MDDFAIIIAWLMGQNRDDEADGGGPGCGCIVIVVLIIVIVMRVCSRHV